MKMHMVPGFPRDNNISAQPYRRENNIAAPPFKTELLFPLEQTFDSFFSDFFGTGVKDKVKASANTYPKINVSVVGKELVVHAAVPGIDESDLKVEMVDPKTVVISGRLNDAYSSSDGKQLLRELTSREFMRRVTLEDVEGEPKEAVLKDGILTLKWDLPSELVPEKKLIKVTRK